MLAGFPAPAADHMGARILLDELLDVRASYIYLVHVDGDSMTGANIYSGDLVIIDRFIEVGPGNIMIAAVNCYAGDLLGTVPG